MKQKLEEKLKEEIRRLERELTVDIPKEIGEAASLGDLSENAEYQAALERQSYIQARLGALKKQYSNLSLVSLSSIPRDKVALGSTVHLQDLDTEEIKVYHLVLGEIADPENGEISPSSPIGRALIGGELGDLVEVKTPVGRRDYEIVKLATIYDSEE